MGGLLQPSYTCEEQTELAPMSIISICAEPLCRNSSDVQIDCVPRAASLKWRSLPICSGSRGCALPRRRRGRCGRHRLRRIRVLVASPHYPPVPAAPWWAVMGMGLHRTGLPPERRVTSPILTCRTDPYLFQRKSDRARHANKMNPHRAFSPPFSPPAATVPPQFLTHEKPLPLPPKTATQARRGRLHSRYTREARPKRQANSSTISSAIPLHRRWPSATAGRK